MASLTSPQAASGGGSSGGSASFSFPSVSQSLSASLLGSFALVKRVSLPGPVNALDFTARGDHLLASTDEPDEGIYLYQTNTGQQKKQVFCKRSGSDLVRFTHHTHSVLVASKNKGWDDSIRYLSLHDNKYLRYFKGHRDRVCSLSMAPRDDSFLSASVDRTVRVWDLRTNVSQGLLHVPQPPLPSPAAAQAHKHLPVSGKVLVAHDPEGMVFAVATSPNVLKLYDPRAFESGPFATFQVPLYQQQQQYGAPPPQPPAYFSFSSLKFSPDGSALLLTTTESCEWPAANGGAGGLPGYTNQVLLLDSYEGTLKQRFVGHEFNPHEASAAASSNGATAAAAAPFAHPPSSFGSLPFEASFSPDGAFVFAGSRSGNVHAWRADNGEAVAVYSAAGSTAPVTAVQFCPTKMALLAADANGQINWWMPPKP